MTNVKHVSSHRQIFSKSPEATKMIIQRQDNTEAHRSLLLRVHKILTQQRPGNYIRHVNIRNSKIMQCLCFQPKRPNL